MSMSIPTRWGRTNSTTTGLSHCFRPMAHRPNWESELGVSLCGRVTSYTSRLLPPNNQRCLGCMRAAEKLKPVANNSSDSAAAEKDAV